MLRPTVCGLVLPLLSLPALAAGLQVTNIESGAVLRHPVALLTGQADAADGAPLTVTRVAESGERTEASTAVLGGRFTAPIELKPGANRVTLTAGDATAELDLRQEPQTNPYHVRIIWYTDDSGNTEYQSEIEGDPQDYAAKLDTVAKLMQTFTAESLNAQGLGRKTFNLELDAEGRVKVHVVRGEHPAEYYHSRDGGQLYGEIHDHLHRLMPDPFAKNVVLMAFTRWDPAQKRALAHTALGGGDMGLFGSSALFSWPSSVGAIQAAFMDERRVDAARSFDDSAGRSTYWGLAATTIGATLHETGHAFGLPHSPEPFCIMSRGFDHINRRFTLVEAPHAHRAEAYAFPDGEVARFALPARLAYHRWFQPDARPYQDGPAAEAEADPGAGTLVLTSRFGLRVVGIDGDDHSRADDVFADEPPTRREYRLADLQQRGGGKAVSLMVMDDQGNVTHVGAERLVDPRRFARTWRFPAESVPWVSTDRFVDAAPEELASEIGRAAPVTSDTPFIDFLAHFRAPTDNRVGHAATTLRCDRARDAVLLTGSDDALRVWLNGALAVERLLLRSAGPDQDATPVKLQAGENSLLVEVSNAGGGWGFYCRLEADGKPLWIDKSGQLSEEAEP